MNAASPSSADLGNTFGGGVVCMARNCLPAIDLLRSGRWTLDKLERWLKAVIANDSQFLAEVTPEILAKNEPNDLLRNPPPMVILGEICKIEQMRFADTILSFVDLRINIYGGYFYIEHVPVPIIRGQEINMLGKVRVEISLAR